MTGKKTAGQMRGMYAVLLLFAPAILLIIFSRGCNMKFKTLEDFGKVNDYSFVGIDGKTYTNKDFKGNVILFFNLQENCVDSCGVSLFTFEKILYQHIRPKKTLKDYKIITFVYDENGKPVNDLKPTEDMLKDKIHNYDPKKWILATGDAFKVFDIEHNGNHLIHSGEEYFGGNSINELMLLVDKENHLRMVLRGDQEGMFRRMKECIALLQKEYSENEK